MFGRGPFGFGGGWGGWGGGPYMRRRGFPLMGGLGMGMGMGGFGGGGSLLGDLAAGGIGYLMGRQSAQQQAPAQQYQTPQYQPPQTPQYQAPQYQAPQYQAPNQQAPAAGGGSESLAQLKLLGHLRQSGLLTNDEFEAEKQKILQGY